MQDERPGALAPLPPGPLLELDAGAVTVSLAPLAGGRIAQIRHRGQAWLVGPDGDDPAAIAWGCYPMAPWVGRLRDGAFVFAGRRHGLARNFGRHAIHGLAFVMPWVVESHGAVHADLSLRLPRDASWPFGGIVRQSIRASGDALALALRLEAEEQAMPACIGWHPWFRKPERLSFQPEAMYPRDADGIATLPPAAPGQGPWDDCFVNERPVVLERDGWRLRLESECRHWTVYDMPVHATCVEPQTGPPDAFNLQPRVLASGQALEARLRMTWSR